MRDLARADVLRFARALASRLDHSVQLVLTGGGEALLLGGTRPTRDLDFGLVARIRKPEAWRDLEQAVEQAAAQAGIVVQYSQDIDRWSSISIPRQRRRSQLWRRIGRLSVRLLDPTCWAVYKLARYLDSDVEDLVAVLRRERVSNSQLARLCGECLRTSPRSPNLHLFRRQVEHFFRTHGAAIWGKGFDGESAIAVFHRSAGIPISTRTASRAGPKRRAGALPSRPSRRRR